MKQSSVILVSKWIFYWGGDWGSPRLNYEGNNAKRNGVTAFPRISEMILNDGATPFPIRCLCFDSSAFQHLLCFCFLLVLSTNKIVLLSPQSISSATVTNMSNSIPVMRKPADTMSKGLNSSNLAAAAVQRHPIDRMQRGEFSSFAFVFLFCKRPSPLAQHV